MKRSRLLALLLAGLPLLLGTGLLAGCSTAKRVRAEVEQTRQKVMRAKKSGAMKCAPRELALAETESEFALHELKQGDFMRAAEHSQSSLDQADLALKNSKGCAPKKVVIKKPKKVVVKKADRDNDGVPDLDDRCPDKPGPAETQGCPDTDGDGLLDPDDKCPDAPGPKENEGCPVGDTDGDGLLDNEDKCPIDAEDQDGFQDEDGCPDRDNDKDGVLDVEDECPMDPGPAENKGCPVQDRDGDGIPDDQDKCPDHPGPPENNGCPDRDGDGIVDPEDKCPDQPGVIEEQGCPKKYSLIVVTEKKIELKQKVHFATGKSKIMRDSYELLDQVADAISSASKVKIRIEGHTDSRGSAAYNLKLSQRRADSVKRYLVKKGIAEERLNSVGYGESQPISSNRTKKGRAMNRRVEFNLVKGEEPPTTQ